MRSLLVSTDADKCRLSKWAYILKVCTAYHDGGKFLLMLGMQGSVQVTAINADGQNFVGHVVCFDLS